MPKRPSEPAVRGLGLLFVVVLAAPCARAQGTPAPAAGPAILIGCEERVRTENWTDITRHGVAPAPGAAPDRVHQWRLRTRLWARLPLTGRLDVDLGLNDESRLQTTPDTPMRLDEILCEQLSLEWRPGAREVVRVGRLNMARDEGFILADGTPGDGSRTAYANAFSWTHGFSAATRLELLALSNPRRELYLPLVNDRRRTLVEGHERLYGFYLTMARGSRTDLRGYALRKEEEARVRPAQPARRLQIVGGRVVHRPGGGWTVTGEFAGEWGEQDRDPGQVRDNAVRAWGGFANVRHAFPGTWKPTLAAGWIGLSGDNAATTRVGGWDPPMSRFPKWSELYIYSLAPEEGVSYWTNLAMWQAEVTCAPSSRISLRVTGYRMRAFRPAASPADPGLFGTGLDRGDLFEARCDFTLSSRLKGHVVYERLWPGDFYRGGATGEFLRFEIIGSWQKSYAHKGLLG